MEFMKVNTQSAAKTAARDASTVTMIK
jgi:hypothetical protein